jgi:hypothetical protein
MGQIAIFGLKKMYKISNGLRVSMVFATLAAVAGANLAHAEADRSQISISARVAVICRAELSGSIIPTTDRVALGQLTELCNVSSGYRVIMDYPVALEGAQIVVDGIAQTLTDQGQITLVDSPISAYKVRNLELNLMAVSQSARDSALNLAFRAVPRGGV